MKTKSVRGVSFEKALERLQEIVAELDRPELGLEASLALFEEGVALSRFCSTKIEEIRKRVEVVLKETPEGFVTEELDAGEGEEEDADAEGGEEPPR